MKKRWSIRYKDEWEITINDILIFIFDCLTIFFMVFGVIGKWIWYVLKYLLWLVLLGLFLFGMFKGCNYIFISMFSQ